MEQTKRASEKVRGEANSNETSRRARRNLNTARWWYCREECVFRVLVWAVAAQLGPVLRAWTFSTGKNTSKFTHITADCSCIVQAFDRRSKPRLFMGVCNSSSKPTKPTKDDMNHVCDGMTPPFADCAKADRPTCYFTKTVRERCKSGPGYEMQHRTYYLDDNKQLQVIVTRCDRCLPQEQCLHEYNSHNNSRVRTLTRRSTVLESLKEGQHDCTIMTTASRSPPGSPVWRRSYSSSLLFTPPGTLSGSPKMSRDSLRFQARQTHSLRMYDRSP